MALALDKADAKLRRRMAALDAAQGALGLPPLRGARGEQQQQQQQQGKRRRRGTGGGGGGGGGGLGLGLGAPLLSRAARYALQMKVSTTPGAAADEFFHPHGARVRVAYVPDPVAWREWDGYGKRIAQMRRTLERDGRFAFTVVEVAELVYKDALAQGGYNVVCFPGGAAQHFLRALGDRGKEVLRDFVRGGGGFVGICAGAYVGSAFGVGLLDAVELPCMETGEWKRGYHPKCPFNFSRRAPAVLGADHGADATATARYNNGASPCRGPVNSTLHTPMGANSIPPAHLHVRPTGRAYVYMSWRESKKNTHPKR